MILVSVGTHHAPFDRLLAAVDALAAELDEAVVVQRGASRTPLPHCEVHDLLPPERLDALLRDARVVVLHGGSSVFLQARAWGRVPVVVPRRPELGEHVDDHQLRFARHLGDEAVVLHDVARLGEVLRAHDDGGARPGMADVRSRRFGEALDRLAHEVVARRRS